MSKTIAVVGATGTQGGSVVNLFLKDKSWKVRAITRNTSSDNAKKLASAGAEVVSANFDDEASLVKAFEGAHVVFGNTNFWEHLFQPPYSAVHAGNVEHSQAVNLANAAAKTTTLEHYIWSTLPAGSAGYKVPHFDSKADADIYIKEKLPALAAKTTFLWLGYYPSNIAYFPMIKPIALPAPAPHVFMQPIAGTTICPSAGDPSVNTGICVRAIVQNPAKTLPSKYVPCVTEFITLDEQLKIWSEITGKPAVSIKVSEEDFSKVWGFAGDELTLNWRFFADRPKVFEEAAGVVTVKELGVEGELVGTKKCLEGLKEMLLA